MTTTDSTLTNLNGKGLSAIVTGGASGLGLATTKRLLDSGCNVMVCDIKKHEDFEAIEARCVYQNTDVTSETDAAKSIGLAKKLFSRLDILVNCAGVRDLCKTYDAEKKSTHPLDTFEQIIKVNTTGTFNMIRLAAAAMAENQPDEDNQRGVIINTASISGIEGTEKSAAYAASKAAVIGMTLPIARDLADLGIRVVTIAPGMFHLPLCWSLFYSIITRGCFSGGNLGLANPLNFIHLTSK
ncbi:unnamed protein product [Dicrocoelium dendriticum]|nr:unnamed protein product [Dicrocoelium dendriticum]